MLEDRLKKLETFMANTLVSPTNQDSQGPGNPSTEFAVETEVERQLVRKNEVIKDLSNQIEHLKAQQKSSEEGHLEKIQKLNSLIE